MTWYRAPATRLRDVHIIVAVTHDIVRLCTFIPTRYRNRRPRVTHTRFAGIYSHCHGEKSSPSVKNAKTTQPPTPTCERKHLSGDQLSDPSYIYIMVSQQDVRTADVELKVRSPKGRMDVWRLQ